MYKISGDDVAFFNPADPLSDLTLRARKLGLIDADKEAAESPWEDPRWEMIQYD